MPIIFGGIDTQSNGPKLGTLRDANDLLDDAGPLRQRLSDDGYLLIRSLHDRQCVLDARRTVLEHMAKSGCIDDSADLMLGRIKPDTPVAKTLGHRPITHHRAVLAVLEGEGILNLFHQLFGKEVRTFDYKWLRAVGHGAATGSHYDVVYMGRGSRNLMTCWTPMGDIDPEQGTLTLCVGSHNLPGYEKIRQTYGRADVDRDLVHGAFSTDPYEISAKYGGSWQTTNFRAGDVIVFGMFMMHASTNNTTDCWRLSCDTRFQPAEDPIDERWIGKTPKGHYAWQPDKNVEPIAQSRQRWGV